MTFGGGEDMKRVSIGDLVNGLKEIPDGEFVCDVVYEYLGKNPVDVDSITKYLHWSDKHYTRNLVYKDERFEMMAICWGSGQVSQVHNHSSQRCWMTVPIGKLRGQNFAVVEMDESRGFCKLRPTDTFDLSDCLAAKVELEEPIHQILNLPEFTEDAVSIHIYSKPFDTCKCYCTKKHEVWDVSLKYTSIDGHLCDGIEL